LVVLGRLLDVNDKCLTRLFHNTEQNMSTAGLKQCEHEHSTYLKCVHTTPAQCSHLSSLTYQHILYSYRHKRFISYV